MLRRVIRESIELVVVHEASDATFVGDPLQIERALVNLCVNASDAVERRGRIHVRTRIVDLEATPGTPHPEDLVGGTWVVLGVEDDGHGIAPDVSARIFEPFYTTKGPSRGTGLGLALVFGIVRQHGGSIRVASTVGVGTTFELWLPGSTPSHAPPTPLGGLGLRAAAPAVTSSDLGHASHLDVHATTPANLAADGSTEELSPAPHEPAAAHLHTADIPAQQAEPAAAREGRLSQGALAPAGALPDGSTRATRAVGIDVASEAPSAPLAAPAPKTVLVIEDDPLVRRLVHRILARADYEVVSAATGEEGVEQFTVLHDHIDVVLLDSVLPGIPGAEVFTKLRELVPDIPVVFCSGYGDEGVPEGVDLPVLPKPYDRDALLEILERARASR
jgi:CheY-like chemotaxis protein